jgi:hypothetical protein
MLYVDVPPVPEMPLYETVKPALGLSVVKKY